MRWVCLFSGTNKIETGFRRCQAHPHFVVNSKKSLVFAFKFCQSRKSIFTEPWICKWQRIFWWLWHQSLNRICKQIAKTRPSRFGKTMLRKNRSSRTVHQWAAWESTEIFPGGGNIDILLIVFRLLTNGRS